MARIAYFNPAMATGRARAAYAKLPDLNIFRMLGHVGDLLDGYYRFGNQLLAYTSLDPVLRELAILRVGHRSGSAYELQQHERIARGIGMADALLDAAAAGAGHPALDDRQRLTIAFVDEVIDNVRASDATFLPLREWLTDRALQELVLTVGYYMTVCRFVETFDVDLEPVGEGA